MIGISNPFTLIDTGEGKEAYPPLLDEALGAPADPDQPDISDIILSHAHGDHVGGLIDVLALLRRRWDSRWPGKAYTPPRLHKAVGSPRPGHDGLPRVLEALQPHSFTPGAHGPIRELYDSQVFPLADTSLLVMTTPGHTPDSISLYIQEDKAIYTADTVLGAGTAVFENLSEYMASLQKMLDFRNGHATGYVKLYPGHGPVVEDGPGKISEYIKHRMEREEQIVGLLGKTRDDGSNWTIWDIVKILFKTYPENLWEPAAYGVSLHLAKLEQEGKVKKLGGEMKGSKWELVQEGLYVRDL